MPSIQYIPLFFLALAALSIPGADALYWLRPRQSGSESISIGRASAFAGLSTSAVFPPPSAISSEAAVSSFFPDATVVGFLGPTPTGDEANLLATAPAAPSLAVAYPLINPVAASNTSTSTNATSNAAPPGAFNVLRQWGNLSPMFSIDSAEFGLPDASGAIPEGCELQQVHFVHRHGARYPTLDSATATFATKVQNATVNGTGFTATGDLAFLNTWTYRLGAEILTPFGRQQLFDMGVGARLKYGELLKNFTALPVFRTTSEERMVQSAQNFAAGFFGIPEFLTEYNQEIIIEQDGFNNTLAPYKICNNSNVGPASNLGDAAQDAWEAVYLASAVTRLQSMIEGNLELTVSDAFTMQDLCAYETVSLGFSSFCGLFTEEEWLGYDYASDLSFWYGNGPGNPTTAAQGLGYVQELVSRLTQTPLDFATANTTINTTLNANSITFPLNQPIYVDATHDTVISSIIVALNFTTLTASGVLPLDHIPSNLSYITSHISPFAATLVGQVLSCPARNSASSSDGLFFRWLLNDGVVPQTGVSGCPDDPDGLCPLGTYVAAMTQRSQEIDFAFDCLANYTVPAPGVGLDPILDGRPPANERPSTVLAKF